MCWASLFLYDECDSVLWLRWSLCTETPACRPLIFYIPFLPLLPTCPIESCRYPSRFFCLLQGLLLYQHMKVRSHVPHKLNRNMDGHETCYLIFALPIIEAADSGVVHSGPNGSVTTSHTWKAIRVDLVVTPSSEYPFALLGWTGSKVGSYKSYSLYVMSRS